MCPSSQLALADFLPEAVLDLGWQVVLFHLRGIKFDWFLSENGLAHARPEVLPRSLAPARFDVRVEKVPLLNEFINDLLLIKWQIPLARTLIAVATLAFFFEHFLQIEVQLAVIDWFARAGTAKLMFLVGVLITVRARRRAKRGLDSGNRFEWQLLVLQLRYVNFLML